MSGLLLTRGGMFWAIRDRLWRIQGDSMTRELLNCDIDRLVSLDGYGVRSFSGRVNSIQIDG